MIRGLGFAFFTKATYVKDHYLVGLTARAGRLGPNPINVFYQNDRYVQATMGYAYLPGWALVSMAGAPGLAAKARFADYLNPWDRQGLAISLFGIARTCALLGQEALAKTAQDMAQFLIDRYRAHFQAVQNDATLKAQFEQAQLPGHTAFGSWQNFTALRDQFPDVFREAIGIASEHFRPRPQVIQREVVFCAAIDYVLSGDAFKDFASSSVGQALFTPVVSIGPFQLTMFDLALAVATGGWGALRAGGAALTRGVLNREAARIATNVYLRNVAVSLGASALGQYASNQVSEEYGVGARLGAGVATGTAFSVVASFLTRRIHFTAAERQLANALRKLTPEQTAALCRAANPLVKQGGVTVAQLDHELVKVGLQNALTAGQKQTLVQQLRVGFTASVQCFTAEMQVLTTRGVIRFDELLANDDVASCDEGNPFGRIEYKTVQDIFRGRAEIWHVHAGGTVLRTTAGHKIYVWGKGWTPARDLEPGDKLRSDNGQTVLVEEVYNTGVEEEVYNCRVADHHTYFVAAPGSPFLVWAHNEYLPYQTVLRELENVPGSEQLLANMRRGGPNWRGYYFEAERAVFYHRQGLLQSMRTPIGVGQRTADIVLNNGLRIETKSWTRWANYPAIAKRQMGKKLEQQIEAYLRGDGSRLLLECDKFIAPEVLTRLNRLARVYGTRLQWSVIS